MNPVDQILHVFRDVVASVHRQTIGALYTTGDDRGWIEVGDCSVELVDDARSSCLPDRARDGDDLEALTGRNQDRPCETHERRTGRNAVVGAWQARVCEEAVETAGRGGVRGEGGQLGLVASNELPEQLVLGLVVQLVDALDSIRRDRPDHAGHVGDLWLTADGLLRLCSVRPRALRVEPEVGPDAHREGDERLVRREEPTGGQVADRNVCALTDEELRTALHGAEDADVASAKVSRSVDTDEGVVDDQLR